MDHGTKIPAVGEIETEAAKWVARHDAGLTPAEARQLERWLAADPRHRVALVFYSDTWAALARPSQSGAGAVLERHLGAMAGRRVRRRIAVASVALVLLLGVGLGTRFRSGPPRVDLETATAVLSMPTRQTLPDGSVVELKENAEVAVDYTASMRRVILRQGEAYFAVQKDIYRPFVVAAGSIEVRAVGTAFSVQMSRTEVEVLVTDGRVAVTTSHDSKLSQAPLEPESIATADAGNRVLVRVTGTPTVPEISSVPPAELDGRLTWRIPRLEFTRAPLVEAIALINRHAPGAAAQLVVVDDEVAAIRVSGVFRADNTTGFVLLLEGAFGVKAERLGNRVLLRKAD